MHVQSVMPRSCGMLSRNGEGDTSITEQCLEIGASVLSGSSAGNLADRFVLAATVAMACREGPEGNTAFQVADQACEIPSETHSAGLSLGVNAEHGVPIRVGFPYHGLGFRVSTGNNQWGMLYYRYIGIGRGLKGCQYYLFRSRS